MGFAVTYAVAQERPLFGIGVKKIVAGCVLLVGAVLLLAGFIALFWVLTSIGSLSPKNDYWIPVLALVGGVLVFMGGLGLPILLWGKRLYRLADCPDEGMFFSFRIRAQLVGFAFVLGGGAYATGHFYGIQKGWESLLVVAPAWLVGVVIARTRAKRRAV